MPSMPSIGHLAIIVALAVRVRVEGCSSINDELAAGIYRCCPETGRCPACPRPPPGPRGRETQRLERRNALEPRSRGSRPPTRPLIHKHHGLAAVEDHAVLQMIAYRARQHAA